MIELNIRFAKKLLFIFQILSPFLE